MARKSGILLHISSLPNRYGIGSFGKECYDFIDFLVEAKHSVWEILPLGQTGFGDSPYSSVCSNSYNPYFISLDALCEKGLLKRKELFASVDRTPFVDYGKLYYGRYPLLRLAFSRFDKSDKAFKAFVKKGRYRDYALYMAIKEKQDNRAFYDWEDKFKYRDEAALNEFAKENELELLFWQFLQFEAEREWKSVRAYAKEKGITIMGDLPLYVAYDSVDVWASPKYFKLDDRLFPKKVAGVPPDYFSATGQLWGNPVYDYEVIEADDYKWWKYRFDTVAEQCDLIRIDHFRGFDRFYEIDYGRSDAIVGEWVSVNGEEVLNKATGAKLKDKIIAEDLGIIDDGVRELMKKLDFPGMRILSFAFNGQSDNAYLPENIEERSVCYTGTHDNDTLMGLLESVSEWDYNNFLVGVKSSCKKLKVAYFAKSKKALAKSIIRLAYACKAETTILPMQDACLLGGDFRMNTPGRDIANWTVKIKKSAFTKAKAKYLCALAQNSGRA